MMVWKSKIVSNDAWEKDEMMLDKFLFKSNEAHLCSIEFRKFEHRKNSLQIW